LLRVFLFVLFLLLFCVCVFFFLIQLTSLQSISVLSSWLRSKEGDVVIRCVEDKDAGFMLRTTSPVTYTLPFGVVVVGVGWWWGAVRWRAVYRQKAAVG
jgi:hypothetical protein